MVKPTVYLMPWLTLCIRRRTRDRSPEYLQFFLCLHAAGAPVNLRVVFAGLGDVSAERRVEKDNTSAQTRLRVGHRMM